MSVWLPQYQMNEVVDRLFWIVGAVGVAIAAILIMRKESGRLRPVRIDQSTLGSGIYLFTSATCPDCETARSLLSGAIGSTGFAELRWESDPGVFNDVGVSAVPATLIVAESGESNLYPGRPDKAVESLSP